jgi:hypothetical protein
MLPTKFHFLWKVVRKVGHDNDPEFLAHLAKGNVSFCHHLASVVRHQFPRVTLVPVTNKTEQHDLHMKYC